MFNYIWTLNSMFAHDMFPVTYVKGRVQATTPLDACEKLFELMNTGHQPEEYRSMSVGDFITLTDLNTLTAVTWVCCNQGWQVVPVKEMV